MKILNIYFKNINSLEGENRIHFDQAPLADEGIFAITGQNGSGKSTILDVITLGLYGETFRFDRPADHVMTKSTTDSFAHVEFSLGTEKYRSSWTVNRENVNNESSELTPQMKLLQLNGSENLLEDSTQKVRNRINSLTGMDFHSFTKSMVLAQGDFAAFLNALDSERMDILEKISGSDLYSSYKNQIEEKNLQAQTLLKQIEQDLNAIPLMDAATREAREDDLEDFKIQQKELETEQQDIQQQLTSIRNKTALEKQIENLSNKQQNLQQQSDKDKNLLETIEAAQELITFEDELTEADSKTEEVQHSKKTLDSYRSELEILQKQLKNSVSIPASNSDVSDKSLSQQKKQIDDLKLKLSELKLDLPKEEVLCQALNQQIEEKKSVLITTETWLQEHSIDKSLLEKMPEIEQLSQLNAERADNTKKQKAHTKWSKDKNQALTKNQQSIKNLKNKTTAFKQQIKDEEEAIESLSEGNSLLYLQDMQEEQQGRVNNFNEFLALASVNAKLGKKKGLFGSIFSSNSEAKEEKQLQKEANHLQLEIGSAQNIFKTLEYTVSNEKLQKKMQSDRQYLVNGKACPLCGALNHPYSKHPSAISNSEQALRDQQKKLRGLAEQSKNLGKQIIAAQKQTNLDDDKQNKLDLVQSQWNSLANKLNAASADLTIDNLSLIKKSLKKEKEGLINLTRLLKKYTDKQHTIVQARSAIELNDTTLIRLTEETERLNEDKNSRPDETEKLEQTNNEVEAKMQTLSTSVLEQLAILGEKMPTKSNEKVVLQHLNARKQEYQTRLSRQQILTEEIQAMDAKITSCSNKQNEINQSIQEHSEQVVKEESTGLQLALVEKQKLIAEKEKQFVQQHAELKKSEKEFLEKIKSSGASDLKALRETLSLLKSQPKLQASQQEITQNISKITQDLDQLKVKFEAEENDDLVLKAEDELWVEEKSIKQKLDIAKQEIKFLQSKLSKQDGLLEKSEAIILKLADQHKVVEACEVDNQLIADENNLALRNKVKQILADQLLSNSNQVLEKISGRYYIRKAESEHGLALEIEDTKQQNIRRLPKTLSGGESFIVSLALSLGLADMSNAEHAMESLFLDEGFGNLDADSLYLVMTTLENLKTQGKVVGIISHVEGVRKRIKTQIHMTKKPNGLSSLKMVT